MAIDYRIDRDYQVDVSVSKECYKVKPIKDSDKDKFPAGTPTISSIRWVEKSVSIDEFAKLVEDGQCFCALFNHDGDYIARRREKFKLQWYLGVDCDNMPMDFDEFLPKLPIPPTISYRTPSDGVGGNRYRLFYFLDCPLTTEQEVKEKYHGLLEELGIEKLITDSCGDQCNRYFNGSYGRKPVCNYTILQTDTIPRVVVETEKKAEKKTRKPSVDDLPIDEKFLQDFRSMRYGQFLLVYCQYESYHTSTPIEYDPNTGIAYLPDDYCEIKPIYRNGKLMKVEDGYRHRALTYTALLLVKINDGMPIEQLIYALTRHATENCDLSDGKITPDTIYSIAQWAMKRRDEIYVKQDKRRFKVSQEIATEQGKSIQKLIGEENQRCKDAEITPFFDPLLTDRENIVQLKKRGISASADFLRGYRKRYSLDKRTMRAEEVRRLIDDGVSVDNILTRLGISRATFYRLKKVSQR